MLQAIFKKNNCVHYVQAATDELLKVLSSVQQHGGTEEKVSLTV
jgi:hypothetical protein